MTGIPFGWTLAGLDTAVRIAITRRSWYAACDTDERYAAGWHAAVELLYAADDPPAERDVIRAAWAAADDLTRRDAENRGVSRARGDDYQGRTDYPRWHAYWETVCRQTASPEEPIVERTALAQIWPRIPAQQQEALQALAAHGDYRQAADALGLTYNTFCARVRHARNAVLRLWWEGETPRRGWRDRRRTTPETQLHSVSAYVRKRQRARAA